MLSPGPVEQCQTVETLSDVGMVRSQPLFANRQHAQVEPFALRVPALVIVQPRQIVETLCRVEMLWPQHLFSDGKRSLVERLGLGTERLFLQVVSGLIEEVCDLSKGESILIHQCCTRLDMRETA